MPAEKYRRLLGAREDGSLVPPQPPQGDDQPQVRAQAQRSHGRNAKALQVSLSGILFVCFFLRRPWLLLLNSLINCFSDLRTCRTRLLDLIKNPNNTSTSVEPAFVSYLALLYGFMWEVVPGSDEDKPAGRPDASKLRNAFVFKWTHTLLGPGTV